MKNNRWIKNLSLSLLYLTSSVAFASPGFWQDLEGKMDLNKVDKLNVKASQYHLVNAKLTQLEKALYDRNTNQYELMLPMPDGTKAMFRLQHAPVYDLELERKFPSIRTFTGYQVDNPSNRGRFDITPHGFHGMFKYNQASAFIDPMQRDNNVTHISYYKKHAHPMSSVRYDNIIEHNYVSSEAKKANPDQAIAGETLKTYRIAIAAAGEYTAFHGGTKELAQAAIVTAVNRVNEIYNLDFSVQLNLIGNNDTVIYTDASTDPYDNSSNDLTANEAVMDNNIGTANYDIGHIFNTGGGGVAYLGVVCDDTGKWGGVTGSSSPTADPFVIDFVAHEIGHQFGGQHTFNGKAGNCGTRSTNDAYEPGSGSTIMAYAGICDDQNLQDNSDAFFHSHSLEQMGTFITGSATCSTNTAINNETPTVSAGSDYTIPASTPFKLSGSSSDPDGDSMTYSWEQFDLGTESNNKDEMVDNGNRPLFRSWLPVSSVARYFPRFSDVLAGTTTIGETYATTDRNMTFKFIARDGKGNTASDTMTATVHSSAGPFTLTSPTAGDTWMHSTTPTVTWNVASTDVAPISCSTVDIILSTDGGSTFTTTVLSGTANDGTENITVPSIDTSTARLQINCADNIFFALNSGGDFTVNGVIPGGDAPVITGQKTLATNEDTALMVEFTDLEVTDTDSEYPGTFTMTLTDGDNYSVSDRTITPDANYNGSLTVPVKVNDGGNDSNTFSLSVTVNSVNDAPEITAANTLSTSEDVALSISVSDLTITDVDNTTDDMTLMVMSGTNYSVNGTTVTPAADFNGSLSVSVKVNDGTDDSNNFDVTVNVSAVNDAPMITGQNAVAVAEDGAITLNNSMLIITDDETSSDAMTLTAMAGSNYTLDGLMVTPDANFNGTLTVPVKVNDGALDSADFNLSVSVTAVNDAPMITGQSDMATDEDTALTIMASMLTIVDIDNTTGDMSVIVASGDNYTVNGSTITPAANFNGMLSVMVRVNDGSLDSNSFTLAVTVNAVNDAPVIDSTNAMSMDEDSSMTLDLSAVNVSDIDSEAGSMTLQVMAGDNYTMDGNQITPAANFNGSLMVNVMVSDGAASSGSAQVMVTVNPVNDIPVATDDAVSAVENSASNNFDLVSNDTDVDGDSLSVTAVSYTGNGTLTATTSGATYTPAQDFTGNETFTYTLSDGNGGEATASVTITVTAEPNTDSGGGSSMSLLMSLMLLPLAIIRRRRR